MEGGVWDVSTSQTEVSNNEGYNTDISSSVGVDSALDPVRGGLPPDFAEETLDVVNNDNTAGQRVFLTKAV